MRHPRELGSTAGLWKGCATLSLPCRCPEQPCRPSATLSGSDTTRLQRSRCGSPRRLSLRARPPRCADGPRPGRGFLAGCGRIDPGGCTKRGFRPQTRRGEGSGSGGSVRAVPQPSRCQGAQELPAPAPGRGLGSGASRHPELPAAAPSDLPSLLPVSHKFRNGDFRARYLFECRRLPEVQLPSLAGLEPGLSGYGWKAGLSQQASVVQPSQAFLQTDSALGQSREGNGEAGEAPWPQGSVWQGAPRGAWGPLLRKGGRVPSGSWLLLRPPSAHAYPFKQPRSAGGGCGHRAEAELRARSGTMGR